MAGIYSLSVAAPFDSSPEEYQEPLSLLKERVNEDPEVGEALDILVDRLHDARTQESKEIAYETFLDRIKGILLRAEYYRGEK